jgi:hypothetical protein
MAPASGPDSVNVNVPGVRATGGLAELNTVDDTAGAGGWASSAMKWQAAVYGEAFPLISVSLTCQV